MKKIVILGCENSHADTFAKFIKEKEEFADIEVIGVYSDEEAAMKRLNDKFGIPSMTSFDEAVGKVDGIVVTARHGDNHYKYARPYIESGIPMFIDKPITVSEEDALAFMREAKAKGSKVTGGSSLKHAEIIQKIKANALGEVDGKTVGGAFAAPIALESVYGGFFFYAQHLTEMICEAFGRYPKSVVAHKNNGNVTVIFRYRDFDITGLFTDGNYGVYYASRFAEKGCTGGAIDLSDGKLFYDEFKEYADLLSCGEQIMSYEDFIAPVFVMNAIMRSVKSGKEEVVKEFKL